MNSPTFIRLFQPRFASMVRSGEKCQTIRPTPKRRPQAGDILDAREWSGLPYRSKQIKIGRYAIKSVEDIVIDADERDSVEVGTLVASQWSGPFKRVEDLDAFARADGFKDFEEMRNWFVSTHGLPFIGILIQWHKEATIQPA